MVECGSWSNIFLAFQSKVWSFFQQWSAFSFCLVCPSFTTRWCSLALCCNVCFVSPMYVAFQFVAIPFVTFVHITFTMPEDGRSNFRNVAKPKPTRFKNRKNFKQLLNTLNRQTNPPFSQIIAFTIDIIKQTFCKTFTLRRIHKKSSSNQDS